MEVITARPLEISILWSSVVEMQPGECGDFFNQGIKPRHLKDRYHPYAQAQFRG